MDSFIILYIMVGLVFLLGGEMFVALWAIFRLTKKMTEMKKQEIHLKENLAEKENKILRQAQDKAGNIIEDAIVTASKMEKGAKINQEELEKILREKLEEVADRVMQSYQTQLEKAKEKDIEMFNRVSKGIEDDLNLHTENLKNILAKQTVESQEIVTQKLDSAYETMLVEVEEYRSERLAKVDEQIYQILQNVTEKVLGKTLSLDKHQDLIIQALEKAKKENIFK